MKKKIGRPIEQYTILSPTQVKTMVEQLEEAGYEVRTERLTSKAIKIYFKKKI